MSLELVSAYYDNDSGYYFLDTTTGWVCMTEGAFARHLKARGMSPTKIEGRFVSKVEAEINRVQLEERVDFAGPIAGWQKGFFTISGNKVLVTSSPALVYPKPGEWKLIRTCLERLLGDQLQFEIFISWLSLAVRSLYQHDFIPGQILFLIGPRHCGKTFTQSLITWTLGERSGRPWDYLTGRTAFNRDLIGAEHLIIADPPVSNMKDRAAFANNLKQFAAEEEHRCHTKHKDALMVKVYQRVSVSANDELHNLIVIPTLESGFEDKCIVLKCSAGAVPPPGYEGHSRTSFETEVRCELPAFVNFLLYEWKIPVELSNNPEMQRFRLNSWQHPEIAELVNEQAPEMQLLLTIDETQLLSQGAWKGNVSKLSADLACVSSSPRAMHFSKNVGSLGFLLSRLHDRFPLRVFQMRTKKERLWCIMKETDETQ